MTTIVVPAEFSDEQFVALDRVWVSNDNVDVVLPERLDYAIANRLVTYLLTKLPNEFAFCVLENLVEQHPISTTLLAKVFEYGDTGCNVAICLRSNLDKEIAMLCENSTDPEVIEHFSHRKN